MVIIQKLDEIMNVNYSDNINVIVQTGGSSKWHTKNIYSDYCQRFKAGKNKLYLEDQSMAANMGDYNTLLILYRGARQSIKQTIICLFYQVQAAD